MSDNPGELTGGLQNRSRRYLWAAGAVGAVFLLAMLSRRGQSNAPQTGSGNAEGRTVYVPTQSETTIINYQSNNRSIGSSPAPGGNDSPPIQPGVGLGSRLLKTISRRVTSGREQPAGPVSGGWGTGDSLDDSGSFINTFALVGRSQEPRVVSQAGPAESEATTRVVYAEFFGDQPDWDTIRMWERHYQDNRSTYGGLSGFESYLRKWASGQ